MNPSQAPLVVALLALGACGSESPFSPDKERPHDNDPSYTRLGGDFDGVIEQCDSGKNSDRPCDIFNDNPNLTWESDRDVHETFHLAEFRRLAEGLSGKPLAKLLTALPSEFSRRQVLIYDSKSSQRASPETPRVLLFNSDATLVVSFTGHAKDKHPERLEVMAYDTEANAFELYFVDGGKFSGKNPAECLACHRSDPRPNWSAYSIWPGVYGSIERHTLAGSKEEAYFRSYLTTRREHALYGALPEPETIAGDYYGAPGGAWVFTDAYNVRLGFGLTARNFDKIAATLQATDGYKLAKYALVGAALGCGDPTTSFGVDAGKTSSFDDVLSQVDRAQAAYLKATVEAASAGDLARLGTTALREALFFTPESVAALQYVVQATLHLDIADWSLTMAGTMQFSSPAAGLLDLVPRLVDRDADFAELSVILDSEGYGCLGRGSRQPLCEFLAERSRYAFASVEPLVEPSADSCLPSTD